MEININMYILPALIALFIKLGILIVAHRAAALSRAFFVLVIVFALHNLCEVFLFLKFFQVENYTYVLTAYYLTSIWALVFTLAFAMEVSKLQDRIIRPTVFAIGVLLTVLLLSTGLIIGGEGRSIGYVSTAERGPLYSMFQVFSAATYIVVISVLVVGYRRAKTHVAEIQCLTILFAFMPLILSAFVVMLLMNLGVSVNATAVLPLGTSAFLFITLMSESKHRLTDVRRFLPWSAERKTSNDIMDIYSCYARDEVSYRDAVSKIERMLVLHKYQKNDENASVTAELMGMPRSSLYSIFNRLKIESRGQ